MSRLPLPQDTWEDKQTFLWMREVATRLNYGAFTWDAPNVGAGAVVDTTLTSATTGALTGVRVGMAVAVTPPATFPAGLIPYAWVPAADQLTIRISNITGGALNAAAGTWSFMAVSTA